MLLDLQSIVVMVLTRLQHFNTWLELVSSLLRKCLEYKSDSCSQLRLMSLEEEIPALNS